MKIDLQVEVAKLRALVGRKRTHTARADVVAGLSSKWEGLQSVALRVLGSWGDAESKVTLCSFLENADNRQFGWSIRGVAIEELARCVGEVDADWVLDRYFALSGVMAKHEFLPVVLALPPEAARRRLVAKSRSPSRDNRQAAMKALGNMPYADRIQLLKPFLTDDDADIRSGARYLVRRLG